MTAKLVRLIRYPIKSVGREDVSEATLVAGQTMPWDRTWAIRHENGHADNAAWARCMNFLRVASSPKLAAVTAALDEASETLRLEHPDRPSLEVNPARDAQTLIDWLSPLVAKGRGTPAEVVCVPGRGMTDTDTPTVSIANMATHRAVEQKIGHGLNLYRWRSNIWLDGLVPWEEFEWEGRTLNIGDAILRVTAPIERCQNVQANPETGYRDLDVLGTLDTWGHRDFSMAAEVVTGGRIAIGDAVTVA